MPGRSVIFLVYLFICLFSFYFSVGTRHVKLCTILILISRLFIIHELPQTFVKVIISIIGASLLSGGHVALRCLHLVVCPQVHHC